MAAFQMECSHGTLSILDPIDDILMTHGARFTGSYEITNVDGDPAWLRLAWCFRWLQSECDFYTAPKFKAGLRLSRTQLAARLEREVAPARVA